MDTDNSSYFDEKSSLRDHFLIAMPSLADSYFSQTVTYICDHNEHGAMGIVINHPLTINMPEVFAQLGIKSEYEIEHPRILAGGPVNKQQGLVIHRNEGTWDSTLEVTENISITASKDVIAAIAQDRAPSGAQLVLGYAGWGANQLEAEITENSWLTVPADERILFDTPVEERWSATAKHLGIDLNLISSFAGHA